MAKTTTTKSKTTKAKTRATRKGAKKATTKGLSLSDLKRVAGGASTSQAFKMSPYPTAAKLPAGLSSRPGSVGSSGSLASGRLTGAVSHLKNVNWKNVGKVAGLTTVVGGVFAGAGVGTWKAVVGSRNKDNPPSRGT